MDTRKCIKYLFIFLLLPAFTYAQKKRDSKIIVALPDSVDVYLTVKDALMQNAFTIDVDRNNTILTTQPREFEKVLGYAIAKAEIKGKTVELTGSYSLSTVSELGTTYIPNDFKKITYSKGSSGWKLLMQVAAMLNGQITFSED